MKTELPTVGLQPAPPLAPQRPLSPWYFTLQPQRAFLRPGNTPQVSSHHRASAPVPGISTALLSGLKSTSTCSGKQPWRSIFIYSSIFFSMILQFLTFFKFLKKYSENSYTQKLLSSLSGFPGRYPRSYVFILFYSNVKKRRNVLKIFSLLGLYFLLVKLSEVD